MKHLKVHSIPLVLAILGALPTLAVSQQVPAATDLAGLPGYPDEHVVDIRVKVLGGYVSVRRSRDGGRWTFNPEFSPLALSGSCDSSVPSRCRVSRGKREYTYASGTTPARYLHAPYAIERHPNEWFWSDLEGNWISYDANGNPISFGRHSEPIATILYGSTGHLSGFADRFGREVLTLVYNDLGQLASAQDYTGRKVTYGYTDDHLTRVLDVRGNEWTYTYTNGTMTTRTDPLGRTTHYSYTPDGSLKTITSADGTIRRFEYGYDLSKREYYIHTRFPSGRVVESWILADKGLHRQDVNGRTILRISHRSGERIVHDEHGNPTRFRFDSLDRLRETIYPDYSSVRRDTLPSLDLTTTLISENGVVTSLEYDSRNLPVRIVEAAGLPKERVTVLSYDQFGQLTSYQQLTETEPRTTTFSWDSYGNLASRTDPEGNVYHFLAHDPLGNVTHSVDPRGHSWRFEYDAAGNLTESRDPLGSISTYQYDMVGNLTSLVDQHEATTLLEYDSLNRRAALIDALGARWRREYNVDGLLHAEIDPEGVRRQYAYDDLGRVTSLTDGNGNVIYREYFPGTTLRSGQRGLLERITFPTFVREEEFDERGRLVLQGDMSPGSPAVNTSFAYDRAGNLLTIVYPDGSRAEARYDSLNRVTRTTQADDLAVQFNYGTWNDFLRIVDPLGRSTELLFDRVGSLLSERKPGGGVTSIQYDPAGNVIGTTDPSGARRAYEYDARGHLVRESAYSPSDDLTPAHIVDYLFDARGDMISYADGDTSVDYIRDLLGRLRETRYDFGAFTAQVKQTYYSNGALRTFTNVDHRTYTYSYDANGALRGIQVPGEGTITYKSYIWLMPTEVLLPGGSKQLYEYDGLQRVMRASLHDPGGTMAYDRHYFWNDMDLLARLVRDSTSFTYEYDSASRLTAIMDAAGVHEAFAYDPGGNRYPAGASGPADWTYGLDNQLEIAGELRFEYDVAGNRVRRHGADSTSVGYVYNEQNRLVRVESVDGTVAEYGYDPFGRRSWKDLGGSRTYFVYSEEGLVAEVDSGGNVTRSFGYQPGAEWSTAPLFLRDQNGYAYYQNDHLGAPEVLIDNQGAVVWSAILQAFGGTTVQVDAVDNPLRLPGQYFDRETGLHYNYFRDYDPATGSYLEADPLGIGGGLNRYAYANGDPLNNTDALGLCVAKQAMGPYAAAQSLGEQAADLVDTAERIGSNAAKLLDGNPCVLDDLIKDAASLALLKRVRAAAKLLQQAAKAGKTVVRKGKVYIRDGVEGVQRDIHELIRVVNENAAPQALQCTADYAQQKCSRFR